jgi:Kef-type K+ transport system membrane component KefB
MFSSTILVVKLLPTTTLHQEHMGGLAIGVLILQDLLAVAALVSMRSVAAHHVTSWAFPLLALKAIGLTALTLVAEQFIVRRMMRLIDRFEEGVYLLALAWCLGNAALWEHLGLSHEVGAFVAGVALARSPISLFLSEGLKPLRDFFLVLFFFMLGAQLDWRVGRSMLLPALSIAGVLMLVKPVLFDRLFRRAGETAPIASQLGVRLGQLSEFGLIIAVLGDSLKTVGHDAAQLVQFTILLTMIVSAYIVVLKYPTPLGARKALHRD